MSSRDNNTAAAIFESAAADSSTRSQQLALQLNITEQETANLEFEMSGTDRLPNFERCVLAKVCVLVITLALIPYLGSNQVSCLPLCETIDMILNRRQWIEEIQHRTNYF